MSTCFNDLSVSRVVLSLMLMLLVAGPHVQADEQVPKRLPAVEHVAEGRLLYANDDDWDWVSPKRLKPDKRSKLSHYGLMEWSALDTMEEGLPTVRGLFVGSPPLKYLSMEQLNELRAKGNAKPYRHVSYKAGSFTGLLSGNDAPNVIIMMHNQNSEARGTSALTSEDITALAAFVRRGGRLLLLDDWGVHRKALDQIIQKLQRKPAMVKPDPQKQMQRAKRVRELVARLADDRWEVRDKATRDLIAMGKQIVPLLRTIQSDDLEVKARIEQVLTTFLPPPRDPAAQGLSNEAMETLYASLLKTSPGAELRNIKRNAKGDPGYALILRFTQEKTAEPTAPTASSRRNGDRSSLRPYCLP